MISQLSHLEKQEIAAIKELKQSLKTAFGKELKEIRIFGSKVRGDFDEESDIDIFLVFDRDVDWRFKDVVYELVYEIDLKYDVLFNVIIYSAKELKNPKIKMLPFIRAVQRGGVKV